MSSRMETAVQIRPYAPRDRDALRQICSDNAEAGQRIERIFPDREAFCNHARAARAPGVHAGVSAENERGCCFFQGMGFTELHREPRFRKPDGSSILYTIIFVKKLLLSDRSQPDFV